MVAAALACFGCSSGQWKAPPIDGEFLVAPPVPGEEKDPASEFDDEDDEPSEPAASSATPAAVKAPVEAPKKDSK